MEPSLPCRISTSNIHITAEVIGTVIDEPTVTVATPSESRILFDFTTDHITGIRLNTYLQQRSNMV